MAQGLSDYQMKYRELTFGSGTDVYIMSVSGLEDIDVRSGAMTVPRGDGSIPGDDWVSAKEIILELRAVGQKQSADLADTIAEVRSTFARLTEPANLYFKKPGDGEKRIKVRPIGRMMSDDLQSEHGFKPFTVRLLAADPRIYSSDTKQRTLGVYDASGGGLDYGMDYDEDFTVDTSSEVEMTNEGDANAYPTIRVYGPTVGTLTGVLVTNVTTGQELDINTTILTGQVLTANMTAHITASGDQVIGLGGSTRYSDWQLPREAFYLAPGSNVLRFEVDGTTTDALCVVTFSDTWL